MKTFSSLPLLAALGALGAAAGASAQVDTSQWKCSSCPYPKGTTGSVDAGVGYVSESSPKFGDYTGLDDKGAFLVLDGTVSHRGDDGYFADLWGTDLGLDSRRLFGQAGRAGLYSLTFGYAEIPRHLTDGARTPFLGSGGSVLTLPPGFPAADTAGMPLGSTLQPIDAGFKFKRFDLGGTFIGEKGWSASLSLRHDERDGTRPVSGSFFSTASQFVAPVNEKTDGVELTVAYATKELQATVSYHVLVLPQRRHRAHLGQPVLAGGAGRHERATRPGAGQPVPSAPGNGGLRHFADDPRDAARWPWAG